MWLKSVAFLGIGQCGGNICDVAEYKGFTTAAINLCKEDLQCLKYVKSKLHLNGYGAGKDRSVAIEKVKEDFDNIAEWIYQRFNDNDIQIVYVVFSSGGGTGSGIGPMIIDLMSDIMPHKKWGAVVVLPFKNEGLSVYANTLRCAEELTQINNLASVFFVDNAKTYNYTKMGRNETIQFINEKVIENFEHVLNITKMTSRYGNFDLKDLMNILSERGNAIIVKTRIPDGIKIEKDTIPKLIEDSLEVNIYADIQFDKVVGKAGMIYEVDESTFKLIDNGLIFKNIGNPIDLFEGYYVSGKNHITTILSGLTFPFNTLKEIDESIASNSEQLQTTIETIKNQSFKSKSFEILNMIRQNRPQVQQRDLSVKPSQSLKDKLAKYK